MKFVALFEKQSIRVWPFRWWLGIASVLLVAAIALLLVTVRDPGGTVFMAVSVLAFILFWTWGLICIATWYHPDFGTIQKGSMCFSVFPQSMHGSIQVFGAWFIAAWFLASFLFLGIGFAGAVIAS